MLLSINFVIFLLLHVVVIIIMWRIAVTVLPSWLPYVQRCLKLQSSVAWLLATFGRYGFGEGKTIGRTFDGVEEMVFTVNSSFPSIVHHLHVACFSLLISCNNTLLHCFI